MDLADRVTAVLDQAEAEGGKVVAIQAVRDALGPPVPATNVSERLILRSAGQLFRDQLGRVAVAGPHSHLVKQDAAARLLRDGLLAETSGRFTRTAAGDAAIGNTNKE